VRTARVRLGAVGYLNARPLVYELERLPRFDVRYDTPSECARLLHEGATDLGLIPSIEYLRGGPYRIVPDIAIASDGPVASVALYTTKPIAEIRSIAMDTSSRTSVALTQLLCARHFKIAPTFVHLGPDLTAMLSRCDAGLIIGDAALLLDHTKVRLQGDATTEVRADSTTVRGRLPASAPGELAGATAWPSRSAKREGWQPDLQKIDLGEVWKAMTGLPFVYAFWAGRPGVLTAEDVAVLQQARDAGVAQPDRIARAYFANAPEHHALGARYLRDNIKYRLGDAERAGLETFYRCAAEAGVVADAGHLEFY
jgi:chorismate dehydratase